MSFTVKDLLKIEVAPALGCTEPTAIALASAAAATLIDKNSIKSIEIIIDQNIYKNGLAVSIPGAKGNSGLDLAAVLGAFGGDPSLKLEVLDPVDDNILNRSKDFLKKNPIKVKLYEKSGKIHIHVILSDGKNKAEAIIEELNDNN